MIIRAGLRHLFGARDLRLSAALFGSCFFGGFLFGWPLVIDVRDIEVVGYEATLDNVLLVLSVNIVAATLLIVGVVTAGLFSAAFSVFLANFLGVQTAVIIKSRDSWLEMLLVTGPHAIMELGGFTFALAAGLVPLAMWMEGVHRDEEPPLRWRSVASTFGKRAAVAYVLILVAALIEVGSDLGT